MELLTSASRSLASFHAIKLPRPDLKCIDHFLYGLVEHQADGFLQDDRAKLEIDVKIDFALPARTGLENPVVVEIFERAVRIGDIDTVGLFGHDL